MRPTLTDVELAENIWTQLDELGEVQPGETVFLVQPDGVSDAQWARVVKTVQKANHGK